MAELQKTKKVWNPFKKEYWTKENLSFSAEDKAKFKADMAKIKEENAERQAKTEDVGKKISRLGWKLTAIVTLPLIGLVTFGILGLIIGGIIGALILFATKKK